MSDPLFKQPGSSRWWCRIPNPNGGRHIRESTGQQDRTAALAVWRRRCRESVQPADQAKDETSLRLALDRRIAERKAIGRAAGTIDCLTKKARQINRVLGPETPLSAVDARAVDAFIAQRRREGAKGTTIHKELVALRGALKLARRQGYAAPHYADVMPLDFSPGAKPKERALSEREVEALLSELAPHRAAIAAFLVATSATYPSEVARVQRADIDLRAWMVRLRGTKASTRDRRVPVPSFARDWLRFAVDNATGGPGGALFAPWASVRRDLHAACGRLSTCATCRRKGECRPKKGCKRCARQRFEPCSPNDLRRTFGRQLRARGIEPNLIAVGMGHKDSRMVERVYGRITPEELAHLLDKRLDAGASRGQVDPRTPAKYARSR